jgi:hypothetical protein
MISKRRNHYDVTNTVRISHAASVRLAVQNLLSALYPGTDPRPITQAFDTFTQLYAGTLPGYVGCDTWYHDAQHSLDCTLATARLLDGYERNAPKNQRIGERRGLLAIIVALFHDAGYIRKLSDPARNGAEYTLTHVGRSGEFLATLLPQLGYGAEVGLVRQLVHFTGYEVALDQIKVSDPLDRMMGFMLGSADILAQISDRCYLEKCRDYLYREFELGGLAGAVSKNGSRPFYASVEDLLRKTPDYVHKLQSERLDGYFQGVHRYLDAHFKGSNPYIEQVTLHLKMIMRMNRRQDYSELRRRPEVIGADAMRQQLRADNPRARSNLKTLRVA